jgi:hypothetical protein
MTTRAQEQACAGAGSSDTATAKSADGAAQRKQERASRGASMTLSLAFTPQFGHWAARFCTALGSPFAEELPRSRAAACGKQLAGGFFGAWQCKDLPCLRFAAHRYASSPRQLASVPGGPRGKNWARRSGIGQGCLVQGAKGEGIDEPSAGRRATSSVGARVALTRRMVRALAAVLTVLLCGCAREHAPDQLEAGGSALSARALGRDAAPRYPEGQYPLDGVRRKVSGGGDCPEVKLQKFSGETLRLSPSARITPSFRAPLLELEQVVREVSLRVYSRVPSSILVAASYGCRTVNGRGRRLSEHALGNAIDIRGFRFGAEEATKASKATKNGAKAVTFDVLVAKHWKARGDAAQRRAARFLQELTEALLERDVFRTLLGPAHRDHDDHFHFDMAPTHYVNL